jgi:hypothetical protein
MRSRPPIDAENIDPGQSLVFDASAPMIPAELFPIKNSSQGDDNGCGSTRS